MFSASDHKLYIGKGEAWRRTGKEGKGTDDGRRRRRGKVTPLHMGRFIFLKVTNCALLYHTAARGILGTQAGRVCYNSSCR